MVNLGSVKKKKKKVGMSQNQKWIIIFLSAALDPFTVWDKNITLWVVGKREAT